MAGIIVTDIDNTNSYDAEITENFSVIMVNSLEELCQMADSGNTHQIYMYESPDDETYVGDAHKRTVLKLEGNIISIGTNSGEGTIAYIQCQHGKKYDHQSTIRLAKLMMTFASYVTGETDSFPLYQS